MRKVLIFCLIILLLFSDTLKAQNKFALVVGINKYFDAPGQLNAHSLRGCVNDGHSIQRMLQNRYGFSAANIETLFDEQATKTNLLYKVRSILLKCKPGDVFVFYYSGHGIWMKNTANNGDTIKHGQSQAMVLSDLYSEGTSFLFRDEQIKEVLNKFIDRQVITTAIFDCCYSENMAAMDYFTLFRGDEGDGIEKDFMEEDLPQVSGISLYGMPDPAFDTFNLTGDKAFDISKTISINARSTVPRPNDIKGSKFLGISATNEYNKGLEIVDVAGERHGAFTAALIDVLATEARDLPAGMLLDKLKNRMSQQQYWQDPTYRFEGDRKELNLVGLKPAEGAVRLKASCIKITAGKIALDKGTLDGVRVGNSFSLAVKGTKITGKIVGVSADTSWASIPVSSVKPGDVFEQTDLFTITFPKLKIYIPSANMTPVEFDKLIKTVVAPMSRNKFYMEHSNATGFGPQMTILRDPKAYQKTLPAGPSDYFTYLLPIPAVMASSFRSALMKDQNVQVVNEPGSADMIPIMTYSDKEGFIMSFNTPSILVSDQQYTYFQPMSRRVSGRTLSKSTIDEFSKTMAGLVGEYLRKKTTAWLNYWPRR
jgi:hypothetical protein